MDAEQFRQFQEESTKNIREVIQTVVNGKIDRMSQKLDDHITQHQGEMESLLPIIEAYKGSKILGELAKWVGGIAIAWLAFKNVLHLYDILNI